MQHHFPTSPCPTEPIFFQSFTEGSATEVGVELGEAAIVKAELVISLTDLGEEHEGRRDFAGGIFDSWGIRSGVVDVC